jgi:hypothetical protein
MCHENTKTRGCLRALSARGGRPRLIPPRILVAGVALAIAAGGVISRASAPVPILVELFTAEGCSSCPPADVLLQRFVDAPPTGGAQIIALGEHVDYWDHQGWTDRFASPALTERQRAYASRFRTESIYTPQMVVDGRAEFVGSDATAARRAIERAQAMAHGVVRIDIEPAGRALRVAVKVSDLPAITRGDRADILVAVTEDQLRSDVKRGENHGRVLTHAAVVRQLTAIAEAAGPTASASVDVTPLPEWRREHVKIVAFVQERRGRAILAAAAMPLGAGAGSASSLSVSNTVLAGAR